MANRKCKRKMNYGATEVMEVVNIVENRYTRRISMRARIRGRPEQK